MGNTCASNTSVQEFDDAFRLSFQSYIDEQNRHIPQTGKIKVLSYNIFIRPPMISNYGDDYKDERLAEFIKSFHTYDIICLQEMFGSYSGRRTNLIQKAQETGFLYSCESPKPLTYSSKFIDGGLLVLSRYPILSTEFCPFPSGLGADFYVNKGVLYTKIRIGNSILHLYTNHAQATYDDTSKYLIKRTEQFTTMQKFIKETLGKHSYQEGDMVLLSGDFNVDGRSSRTFKSKDLAMNPAFKELPTLLSKEAFTEYDALMSCLTNDNQTQIEDLVFENNDEHPVTFGDYYVTENNEKKPKETVLTHDSCHCVGESLDYIFRYYPEMTEGRVSSPGRKSDAKKGLSVQKGSAIVQKFFVKGHKFDQLSDHYGVQVTLEYSKGASLNRGNSETSIDTISTNESPSKNSVF